MAKYSSGSGPTSYGRKGKIVTPGNADIPGEVKAVCCLTAGNITIVPEGNADADTLAFVGVPAGFTPPWRVRRVTAATCVVATVES